MLSARDPMRRRQPVDRPLDVVALELLVSITQALLAGILLALASQLGGDARAYGLPVPGLLAVLGIAVGAGWLVWLTGGSGWVMASVGLATSVLAGALWLLALQDAALPRLEPLVGLIAVACALYGLVAGVFLDGPHRAHWKGGISQPHRGVPQTRTTPARSRARTRSRQLDGASPTRAASSLLESRALFWSAARISKSIRSRPEFKGFLRNQFA